MWLGVGVRYECERDGGADGRNARASAYRPQQRGRRSGVLFSHAGLYVEPLRRQSWLCLPPFRDPSLPLFAIFAARDLLMPLSLRASYFLRFLTCPPPRLPGIIASCTNALRKSCKRETTRIPGGEESRFSSRGNPVD